MGLFDTLPVYVSHVTVTSHGRASVRSVFIACVYQQRMFQRSFCQICVSCEGIVFPGQMWQGADLMMMA